MVSDSDFAVIKSPVECYKLSIMAVYSLMAFIICLGLNFILALGLASKKELSRSFNLILFTLAIINLIGASIGFPLLIISNLECGWVFQDFGCQIYGFFMSFTGIASVYLLTIMSYERYKSLRHPCQIQAMETRKTGKAIVVSLVLSLFWSVIPLTGAWSHYSLEGALTSCSLEWRDRSLDVTSFNITIMIFVFILPFIILFVTNIMLIRTVHRISRLRFPLTLSSRANCRRRLNFERNVTISSIFLIFSFMITWLPYAFSSMYTAFVDSKGIDPFWTTLPALFAKTSLAWSPAVYILVSGDIRRKIGKQLGLIHN